MSDDLVERLRRYNGMATFTTNVHNQLIDEAASAIEARDAEIARLKEALRPFADRGRIEFTVGNYYNPDPAPDKQIVGLEVFIEVGMLRRAASLLRELEQNPEDTK